VLNNICRSAVPAQKYLPERRSAAFRHYYTPEYIDSNVGDLSPIAQIHIKSVSVSKYRASMQLDILSSTGRESDVAI